MSDINIEEINGLILLDKSEGFTSFASDGFIKKLLKTKKVGHIGTLDPFATGLLPLCVGKGLRFVRFADGFDKAYRCVASFGKMTDTMDKDGEVIGGRMPTTDEIEELKATDYKIVRDAFSEMTKIESQMPPKYSAKKINGKKAYELARQGVEVELKPHKVKITKIDILKIELVDDTFEVEFEVYCSKGTYIRTICDDIGKELGFGAYAKSLRRIMTGQFSVEYAYTEDDIKKMCEAGDMSFIKNASSIVSFMPELKLNEKQAAMVKNGKKLDARPFSDVTSKYQEDTLYRATFNDELIAVVYVSEEDGKMRIRIERMLA
ncbi:MAG: tRNA pseudouridine(55) synthase TruB [Clostridiales bacterium]|nr:tRNA pseudouridine(55) synthase TruB [Clostridiales bacterium]